MISPLYISLSLSRSADAAILTSLALEGGVGFIADSLLTLNSVISAITTAATNSSTDNSSSSSSSSSSSNNSRSSVRDVIFCHSVLSPSVAHSCIRLQVRRVAIETKHDLRVMLAALNSSGGGSSNDSINSDIIELVICVKLLDDDVCVLGDSGDGDDGANTEARGGDDDIRSVGRSISLYVHVCLFFVFFFYPSPLYLISINTSPLSPIH